MDSSSSSNMMAGAPLVNLTIDAASIGCRNKSAWMQAQVDTWRASNVRFFFESTEQDDIDPTCNEVMKPDTVKKIALFCGRQMLSEDKYKLRMLAKAFFAQPKWLEKTNKGIGWLCAQQRFASMLGKGGKFYQIQLEVDKSFELPSFLLIQDDDTYYNMDMLEQELLLKVKDVSIPFAAAGCLVHMPIHMLNFSFPYGGYGTILSRGAIMRLIQPIYCNRSMHDESRRSVDNSSFESHVCDTMQNDIFGEKQAFQNGMSISDLMRAHAASNPFRDYMHWKRRPGYCFHGDWIIGYFLNFYVLLDNRSTNPAPSTLPNFRMDSSLGYQYGTRNPKGNCGQKYSCSRTEHAACHRQTPESMMLLHDQSSK
jgi:hypothetical protein